MSLSFVFKTDVSFVPTYEMLNRDIDFYTIFLDNLVGPTLQKGKSIYDRLGAILKSLLTSSTCISTIRSPKAAVIIRANPLLTGWKLLEKLLCSRLVICGGITDYDIQLF